MQNAIRRWLSVALTLGLLAIPGEAGLQLVAAATATPTATPAGTNTPTATAVATNTPLATISVPANSEPNQVTLGGGNIYRNGGKDVDTSGVPLVSTNTDLNALTGAGAATSRVPVIIKVPAPGAGATTTASVWQNTTPTRVIVRRVVLDVTTACTTGSSTLNIGTTAATATTMSGNLLDTVACTAIGTFDNITNAGTNGKATQSVPSGAWITAGPNQGDLTALVGNLYIEYIPV